MPRLSHLYLAGMKEKKMLKIESMLKLNKYSIVAIGLVLALTACGGGGGGANTTTPPVQLGEVTALFPSNGANWNDYVSGSNWRTAADAACNAASDTACLHGGERRVVVVTGKTDCTGLTAADDLGAFNWVCTTTIDHLATDWVHMVSTGLAAGKSLSDLIDFGTFGFKTNKVTVYDNAVAWGVTPSSTWWTNLVTVNNAGGSLATASTIYLVTNDPALAWTLDADKVALVIKPGLTIIGPGINTNVISSAYYNYLWIEGNIDASADRNAVYFSGISFSMLRNLKANNAAFCGVYLDGASKNTLLGVTVANNINCGVFLSSVSNNNTLLGVTAANNGTGVFLSSASNNMLLGVTVANNGSYGVYLDGASNNTFAGVTATNTSFAVYLDRASNNNTFTGVTAANNGTGVSLDAASSNNAFAGVTAANNSTGIYLGSTSNNTLVGVTAANNIRGIDLESPSSNNTFAGVTAANNFNGVYLNSASNNTFTGPLKIGNNATEC
jgi:parallel beta-helix repeat protein